MPLGTITNCSGFSDLSRHDAAELGINYLGVCCGASPMLIRQVAEAVGRTTEASRFSEKMQNHFMYGDNERLPDHIVALGSRA